MVTITKDFIRNLIDRYDSINVITPINNSNIHVEKIRAAVHSPNKYEIRHVVTIGKGYEEITIDCRDNIYRFRLIIADSVKSLTIKSYGGYNLGKITLHSGLTTIKIVGQDFYIDDDPYSHCYMDNDSCTDNDQSHIYDYKTRDGESILVIPPLPINLIIENCNLGISYMQEDFLLFSKFKDLSIVDLGWCTYCSDEYAHCSRDTFYTTVVPLLMDISHVFTYRVDDQL